MSSSDPRDPDSLRDALERSTLGVRYDVESGLARHRQLVGNAAPLPEWASSLRPARRSARLWLVSSLALLGALSLWVMRSELRALPKAASSTSERVRAVEPGARPAPLFAPLVQPLPSTRSAVDTAASRAPTHQAPPIVERAVQPLPESPHSQSSTPASRALVKAAPRSTPVPRASHVPGGGPSAAPLPDDLVAALTAGALPNETPSDQATAAPVAPHQPAPEAIDPEVIEEMQQLATAERLLATMPSRTLSMVREGMRRFARGYLAQERRYLEIMALLALHMPRDAELLSRNFLRDYPNGPYRRKIERALERGAAE